MQLLSVRKEEGVIQAKKKSLTGAVFCCRTAGGCEVLDGYRVSHSGQIEQ